MAVFDFDYYRRLKEDYHTHGSLCVAFDYDNTVYDYHHRGISYTKIIQLLCDCKALGFTLMLFTANTGSTLSTLLQDLRQRSIPFDLVNENSLQDTRKPYYNILLDDRVGLFEAYTQLRKLVDELPGKAV